MHGYLIIHDFRISTNLQRDADRKNQHPTSILSKIRQQNISATSINSPYKPLSITERTFREDLARGVRRSKVIYIYRQLIRSLLQLQKFIIFV